MELRSGRRKMAENPDEKAADIEEKRRKMAKTSILDLPLELASTILSRLPEADVYRYKSVCKLWKTYISHPDFSFSQEYLPVILFPKNSFIRIFRLEPRPEGVYTYSPAKVIPGCRKFIQDGDLRDGHDRLVGSCNGLVCLLHQSKTSHTYDYLSVSNPMTQEFRLLRAPPKLHLREELFMFGFSGETSEYKVLRIYKQIGDDRSTRAQVCTVNGSETDWRDIVSQTVPSPRFNEGDDFCGASFKGALHWITRDDQDKDEHIQRCLVSFDIAKESIQQTPLPAETNSGDRNLGLGVLRGCLCVFQIEFESDDNDGRKLNVWSMKEHGVMESWAKETIESPFIHHWCWHLRTCHTIVHLNHHEMVALGWDDCSCKISRPTNLFSYNREKHKTNELYDAQHKLPKVEDAFRNGGDIAPYGPTFLPLDSLLRGKGS